MGKLKSNTLKGVFMKKILMACAITSALMFTGCGGSGFSTDDAGSLTTINYGTVVGVRNVELSGGVGATLAGAAIGGLAGAAFGQGLGKDLAIAGGALAGGAIGNKVGSSGGQELNIKLDNGQMIQTVYKVTDSSPYMFRDGDRVMVQVKNGKIQSVSRSSN